MESPFVDIHTHHHPSEKVVALYNVRLGSDPKEDVAAAKYLSAGIHPWDAARVQPSWRECLEKMPVAAIGEIGLDWAVTVDRNLQRELFRWQLEVATSRRMPVIVHCVRAYNEVLADLAHFEYPVVFHGFTGSKELAAQLVRAGGYLSFGVRSLDSTRSVEALRHLPVDRLFFESDDQTIEVGAVYERAAGLIHTSVDQLKQTVFNNFQTIFA